MAEIEITLLGSGSSGGVPRGDGDWGDCDPAEPRNRRNRCSMLARLHGPDGVTSVVIDTEMDFIKLGVARDIAARMGAAYYTLQELSDNTILRIAKNAV